MPPPLSLACKAVGRLKLFTIRKEPNLSQDDCSTLSHFYTTVI